jgi:hypothetical protein
MAETSECYRYLPQGWIYCEVCAQKEPQKGPRAALHDAGDDHAQYGQLEANQSVAFRHDLDLVPVAARNLPFMFGHFLGFQ